MNPKLTPHLSRLVYTFISGIARAPGRRSGYVICRPPSDARVLSTKVCEKRDGVPPLVEKASLPATFPTLVGRVNPNMTEQAALTWVNLGQQTHILLNRTLSFLFFSFLLVFFYDARACSFSVAFAQNRERVTKFTLYRYYLVVIDCICI